MSQRRNTATGVARSALRGRPERLEVSTDMRSEALSSAFVEPKDKNGFVSEIGRLWHHAQKHFVTIGMHLIAAKKKLRHGEFEAMVSSELPFSKTVAFQLRMAAEAITSGRLAAYKEQVPKSYSTVYLLSTLDDEALERARAESLIRPDVRRTEIMAFRSRLAALPQEAEGEVKRLRRELARLERERDRVEGEIGRVRGRLAHLGAPESVPTAKGRIIEGEVQRVTEPV